MTKNHFRYEVVTAIVSAARQDFNVVAKNEALLNNVKERTRDKVFKIRWFVFLLSLSQKVSL